MMTKLLKNQILKKLIGVLIFSTLVTSCDFTPRFHKRILLAQEYLNNQDYKNALNQYRLILRDNPSNDIKVKIHYQIAEILSINLGKSLESLEHYRKVKQLTEDPLWLVKAEERIAEVCFTYKRDYECSSESYKKLTEFTPRLSRYDFYEYRLAQSYSHMLDYEKAEIIFNDIQKRSNHEYNTRSFYELGLINFEMKKWKYAIAFWKEYIKRETRRDSITQAKFLMANAYETMENLKTAYNIYYSILGEYPNTQVIQNRLNAIYARRVARKR
ncbi:tetratricopeptide repeat protein [Bacteriovorax sp. BSW11_IV]|uniref:tetratricopeptide repeat protein n=1 Tax=Bacteriovorax sp. BSW11_IV TaxID=1353529 RepID=UPI0012DE8558|nr:hypothetical protein [Bacteriovorax sp. BSW11_IV]